MSQKHPARQEIVLYMNQAHQMLTVAAHNLNNDFYTSAINRAYYAIFYAANAMISTQGLARSKHSGVIAAFRRCFVKPGLIEPEYSAIYGRLMDDRHVSDYDIDTTIAPERVKANVQEARQFVERIETYLRREGWL